MNVRCQLVKLWPTFKASNKVNCIGENSAGGLSSYTGLLSCLQMAKSGQDVRPVALGRAGDQPWQY